jgi:hypothetical protein
MEPTFRCTDEFDVGRFEADLLVELAKQRSFGALRGLDAALRKLPATATAPAGNEHTAASIGQDDADVRAKPLFVDGIHVVDAQELTLRVY